ncbi:CbtB-domain containing protein [Halobacteria archaeon HArc-gm2]|nr:CbtB-domain containing protein [Halobacteria archaeon HArc-gm2]
MPGDTDTVRRRIDRARTTLTPAQMAVGLGLIAALGFTLLFVQDPLVHDGLHNIRHGAGVTCH